MENKELEQVWKHINEQDNIGVVSFGKRMKNKTHRKFERLTTLERIKNGHKRRGLKK